MLEAGRRIAPPWWECHSFRRISTIHCTWCYDDETPVLNGYHLGIVKDCLERIITSKVSWVGCLLNQTQAFGKEDEEYINTLVSIPLGLWDNFRFMVHCLVFTAPIFYQSEWVKLHCELRWRDDDILLFAQENDTIPQWKRHNSSYNP